MKKIVLLLFIFFWQDDLVFAQNFSGVWLGSFEDKYENSPKYDVPFVLVFLPVTDTSIEAYSITYFLNKGRKDSSICKMRGKLVNEKKIYLEEFLSIHSAFPEQKGCAFQKMELIYSSNKKKTQQFLDGTWDYVDENCSGNGGNLHLKKEKD